MSSQELPQPQQLEAKAEVPSSDAVPPSSPSPVKQSAPNPETKTDEARAETTTNDLSQDKAKDIASNIADEPAKEASEPENPRLTALHAKQLTLQTKLAALQSQHSTFVANAKLPSGLDMPSHWNEEQRSKSAMDTANAVIKEHIALLHSYNEIKDIGMGLMGLVADRRGVRAKVVMEEFGMGEKD